MDPNPEQFPIVSYVLSRIKSTRHDYSPVDPDIEQPPPPSDRGRTALEMMPRLNDPSVMASMADAVAEVVKLRSLLQVLGDRPDHESVDAAMRKIAESEAALSRRLEEIVLSPRPEGSDRMGWRTRQAEAERAAREEAERERGLYRAVVQLEGMHAEYEELLRQAEKRLVKIYGSAEGAEETVEVDEEVVEILREGSVTDCLERVELSGRQLRFLPEAFGRLRGLVVMNLSNNQLTVLPDSVAGLEHLQELNIASNLLVSLPDSIGLLLNLKIFNASGNKLKALPDSISHCKSLVELDVSYNELTYLPTNIGYELVLLQKLSIHLNKLRSLPISVCEMTSLRYLDAHFNELRGLPQAIGSLTNLEVINLSSNFNDLTELPYSFGDLTNLKDLDLSNNQIHALPDTFGRLDNLIQLNLDQNPLVMPLMEVVQQGVEAVKEHMAKRWLDILLEEERKSVLESSEETQTGWLTSNTSWLNNLLSGVSETVTGYMGTGKTYRDPVLDQQL
ncbi:hypothetical protein QJS04_geneDACA014848 [Acorus gramineus]|uniref:Uncharacterized protein n=1 Tax=Acorus gramineus TaxID=55184 RepID=A0AAV9A336_ACOGR|nr:hypothetical protein QJS04_geneDACA014848 [Acorus gramineus]